LLKDDGLAFNGDEIEVEGIKKKMENKIAI